jgi:hypothetical protein
VFTPPENAPVLPVVLKPPVLVFTEPKVPTFPLPIITPVLPPEVVKAPVFELPETKLPELELPAEKPPAFEEAVEILPELEPPKVPVLPVLTKLPVLLFEENEPVFTAYAGTAEITVKTAMSETTNVFIIFFFILIFLGLVIFIYFFVLDQH